MRKNNAWGGVTYSKGFTLIELLAVIVILAIIALIATPIVLDIIEDSKESANIQSINSLVHMAEIYATTNETTGNLYDKVIDKIKGTKPDNGVVYVNKKGEVALALKYNNKCYVKAYDSNKITQSKNEECIVPVDYLMAIGNINGDQVKVFNSDIERSKIERVITVSTNEVPNDVIGSFDVSEKQNGSIMAWYKDEDSNGLYELYIGQDGGVKANPDSLKLFFRYSNVISLNLSNLDTSNVTNMQQMFQRCENLQTLDLSTFDTFNVTSMEAMFSLCGKLEQLNISNFNTTNVVNMEAMFQKCLSLKHLDLSNFDTRNVISMSAMFNGCSNLLYLDVSSFNTSKVENMHYMFAFCKSLNSLDVSSFNTSNVIDMSGIFGECKSLEILNLNNFDTSKVTNIDYMFNGTINLKTVNMNKANFSKVTTHTYTFSESGVTSIIVKDETAKTFIEARLLDASITGTAVTIG